MKRRKWDAKTKAAIVLQGLKGKSVGDLCTEHQINQAQYYQWRENSWLMLGKRLKYISRVNG